MVAELLVAFYQMQIIVIVLAALLILMGYLLFAEMNNADRYRNALIRQRQRRED